MVNTHGLTALHMRVIGSIIESMVSALTCGRTVEDITVNGQIMIWRDMESTTGQTVDDMRVSIIMIRKTDTVSIIGLMGDSTRDGG